MHQERAVLNIRYPTPDLTDPTCVVMHSNRTTLGHRSKDLP